MSRGTKNTIIFFGAFISFITIFVFFALKTPYWPTLMILLVLSAIVVVIFILFIRKKFRVQKKMSTSKKRPISGLFFLVVYGVFSIAVLYRTSSYMMDLPRAISGNYKTIDYSVAIKGDEEIVREKGGRKSSIYVHIIFLNTTSTLSTEDPQKVLNKVELETSRSIASKVTIGARYKIYYLPATKILMKAEPLNSGENANNFHHDD